MTSAYNGRMWDAKVKERLPVQMAFRQGLMEVEYWAVPRNAPNREDAFRFIAFSLQANRQASFSKRDRLWTNEPGCLGVRFQGSQRSFAHCCLRIAISDTGER